MPSKDIYPFKPTYLYIKQHKITGKLYFGKTVKSDPVKYLGSGKLWRLHIKKHGGLNTSRLSGIVFSLIKNQSLNLLKCSLLNRI